MFLSQPRVLFEVSNQSLSPSFLIAPAFLFLLGVAAVWMEKRKIGYHPIKGMGYVICALSLIGALVIGAWTYFDRSEGAEALRTGAYSVVSGSVEDFRAMPYEGHAEESFVIAGRRFSYSDYVHTGCFNQTASHGGPIRSGQMLRVFYSDDCILRLEELAEPASTSRSAPRN